MTLYDYDELKCIRVDRKKHTTIFFRSGNARGKLLEINDDGKLTFHTMDDPFQIGKYVVHARNVPAIEYSDGTKVWVQDGVAHRLDGPAVEHPNGKSDYWINGISLTPEDFDAAHRHGIEPVRGERGSLMWVQQSTIIPHRPGEKPAIIRHDGQKEWYFKGRLHRVLGPAVTNPSGTESWYMDGLLHRTDGPASVSPDAEGWFHKGMRHRAHGPAITHEDGTQEWWNNDRRHRVDGPAVEYQNGDVEYWVKGKKHSEEEYADWKEIDKRHTDKIMRMQELKRELALFTWGDPGMNEAELKRLLIPAVEELCDVKVFERQPQQQSFKFDETTSGAILHDNGSYSDWQVVDDDGDELKEEEEESEMGWGMAAASIVVAGVASAVFGHESTSHVLHTESIEQKEVEHAYS